MCVCKCCGKYIEAPLCAQIALLAKMLALWRKRAHFGIRFSLSPAPPSDGWTRSGWGGDIQWEELENFRHQKELLSIITGLAPKELHLPVVRSCFFFFTALFLFFRLLALKFLANNSAVAYFYANFIYIHFFRSFLCIFYGLYVLLFCGDELSAICKYFLL